MSPVQQAKQLDPELSQSNSEESAKNFQSAKYKIAPNGKRIAAFFIDAVITGLITRGIISLFSTVLHVHSVGLILLMSTAFSFVYWVVQAIEFQGTPGKKIMGLRIVTASYSRRISYGQMILREIIGRPLSMLPLFLGYFWGLFSKDHRAWHDTIGKTRVVEYP